MNRRPGGPTPDRKWPLRVMLLAGAGLLAAGGLVVYRTHAPQQLEHARLVSVGETLVRLQISPEFTAVFSPAEETRVDPQGGGKYLVQGWVDLISESGGNDRHVFSCVIHKTPAGDWVGEQITVLAQS